DAKSGPLVRPLREGIIIGVMGMRISYLNFLSYHQDYFCSWSVRRLASASRLRAPHVRFVTRQFHARLIIAGSARYSFRSAIRRMVLPSSRVASPTITI